MHITLIDLLKHYHSQFTLADSPIPLHVVINDSPSIVAAPPPPSCSGTKAKWLIYVCSYTRRGAETGSFRSSIRSIVSIRRQAAISPAPSLSKMRRRKKEDDWSLIWANEIPRDLHSNHQPFNVLNKANKLVSVSCLFSATAVKHTSIRVVTEVVWTRATWKQSFREVLLSTQCMSIYLEPHLDVRTEKDSARQKEMISGREKKWGMALKSNQIKTCGWTYTS